jgi:tRNA(Ile)-lysidine synthase
MLCWESHCLRFYRGRLWLDREYREAEPLDAPWDGLQALELGHVAGSLELIAAGPETSPTAVPPRSWRVRSRRGGERIRSTPESAPRKVKALLQQARLPPWLRDSVPLLFAGDELLALGDWLLATELQRWLAERGLALRWRPANPHLAHWHAGIAGCSGGDRR